MLHMSPVKIGKIRAKGGKTECGGGGRPQHRARPRPPQRLTPILTPGKKWEELKKQLEEAEEALSGKTEKGLLVREDPTRGVVVEGLKTFRVES